MTKMMTRGSDQLIKDIAAYWNENIHDLEVASSPAGTETFFEELDQYRFEKLHYLPEAVSFFDYRGKNVLEVGCGLGLDLARLAKGGALVTGIDLSSEAIGLAQTNFSQQKLSGSFFVMNGEAMDFASNLYDMVYAHGVLQYTANAERMVAEIIRVLKPGGEAILMVYNRYSWLNALSKLMKVDLEHEDAPVLRKLTIPEFRRLLAPFARHRIVPERFPVESRLHQGLKAQLYNRLFVGAFNRLPRRLVRPLGWHLMGFATKGDPA